MTLLNPPQMLPEQTAKQRAAQDRMHLIDTKPKPPMSAGTVIQQAHEKHAKAYGLLLARAAAGTLHREGCAELVALAATMLLSREELAMHIEMATAFRDADGPALRKALKRIDGNPCLTYFSSLHGVTK